MNGVCCGDYFFIIQIFWKMPLIFCTSIVRQYRLCQFYKKIITATHPVHIHMHRDSDECTSSEISKSKSKNKWGKSCTQCLNGLDSSEGISPQNQYRNYSPNPAARDTLDMPAARAKQGVIILIVEIESSSEGNPWKSNLHCRDPTFNHTNCPIDISVF